MSGLSERQGRPVSSPVRIEVLAALAHRAEQALRELTEAHRSFVTSRTRSHHGALSIAVVQAHQVLKSLEAIRDRREHPRYRSVLPGSTPSRRSDEVAAMRDPVVLTAPTREVLQSQMHIDQLRIELRRTLSRAVEAVEDADVAEGGDHHMSASNRSAAATATALRSLLHTRSLLSVELRKMDSVVQGLASSSEPLAALKQTLEDVDVSMAAAQRLVRGLLRVQSRDDALLRLSAALFLLVVLYIIAQRVGRFFPITAYVSILD